jgi:hypothetical protein
MTLSLDQLIAESLMIPLAVIVHHKLVDDVAQTSLAEDNHAIQTLCADRAYEPFRVGIGIRRLDRRLHDAHAGPFDDTPESIHPLRIPVTDQSPISHQQAVDSISKPPRRLAHKGVIRVRRRASDVHAPRAQIQHNERVRSPTHASSTLPS